MPAPRVPFNHVGVLVQDLEAAMEELSRALGLTWGPVRTGPYEPPIRFVFSVQGPPHLELIEGSAEGPWSTADGPRIDHIGYWSSDLPNDKLELDAAGLPIDVDGEKLGNPVFSYHDVPLSGMRVELVSEVQRPFFYSSLGLPLPE